MLTVRQYSLVNKHSWYNPTYTVIAAPLIYYILWLYSAFEGDGDCVIKLLWF